MLGARPISNNLDEAKEMVALAAEKATPYGIDLNHRFTTAAQRRWLDEGRMGVSNMSTAPDEIDGSGRDGLAAQLVIDAAIRSVQSGTFEQVEPT